MPEKCLSSWMDDITPEELNRRHQENVEFLPIGTEIECFFANTHRMWWSRRVVASVDGLGFTTCCGEHFYAQPPAPHFTWDDCAWRFLDEGRRVRDQSSPRLIWDDDMPGFPKWRRV